MPQELSSSINTPLSLSSLLLSLAIGVVLALMLRWHYQRFGSTLSNRAEFAQVFPFVLLTTILIISVMKSSLALSLGLVGALSIVRFRTPIKEPEELAYLFLCIGMGLGLGAGRIVPTVIAGVGILVVMALLKWVRRESLGKNLYLSIDWQGDGGSQPDKHLERVNDVISRFVTASDLRRFDVRQGCMEATYLLDISSATDLSELLDELRRQFPSAGVTFLDQNQQPSA
jgi:hypothetical protein